MNKIEQIKNALKLAIENDPYFTGVKVFKDFDTPIWESNDLPVVNVVSGEERAERLDHGIAKKYKRTLDVFFEACVKTTGPTFNDVNALLGNIERVLGNDPNLSNIVDEIEYDYLVSAKVNPGKSKLGVGNIFFKINYIN